MCRSRFRWITEQPGADAVALSDGAAPDQAEKRDHSRTSTPISTAALWTI